MRIILFILLTCFLLQSVAQDNKNGRNTATLAGRVADSVSKKPIEYATVSLLDPQNSKIITGITADKDGNFELSGIVPGSYRILIEFIGYKPYSPKKLIEIRKNAFLDLKMVVLAPAENVLQGVTVTSQQKLIEMKIDKMVFNAEKDLTAQAGVATDLLKKIPMVSVDIDGNVELSGSNAIRFLINGKPSTAFGSNISEVLQSLPASQIKSIEVITNPGAKYDAQGLGGIINIILKQNTARGINGNIGLTAGTRNENGSFNFNARQGDFGINAFVSGNYRLRAKTPSQSQRISTDSTGSSVLDQVGESRIARHGFESGAGFDWTFNKLNSLTGSVAFNNFGSKGDGFSNQVLQAAGSPDIFSLNQLNNRFRFRGTDVSLTYKRKFKKEDQELEIGGNGSFGNTLIMAANNQFLQPSDSLYYGINSRNPGASKEWEVHADYTQPIKKDIRFSTGVKLTSTDIDSRSAIYGFKTDVKNFNYDSSLSNSLNYRQWVYAVYAEFSLPVKNWFEIKAGGRYERTEINTFFSNAGSGTLIPGYNTFVPSIYFSRKLSDNDQLRLNYSERIERPQYFDLNPFVNTSDPKNISKGNPYLKPETGNRIELSFNHSFASAGSMMIAAFYRKSKNDIQPYVMYYPELTVGDSVYNNVSVSMRQNIGTENNMGINLFADIKITSRLTVRGNGFFFYRHTINKVEEGLTINSFNYRFNANTAYQFSSVLSGEFFGNFNSARNEVQGKYPSFVTYNFALRRQFWNKKGSLALTANNPFNKYVNQKTILNGTNFYLNSLRQVPFQSFGMNFTWKFGKLEFRKEQKDRSESGGTTEG
jgi:ferric enterobactin receptor